MNTAELAAAFDALNRMTSGSVELNGCVPNISSTEEGVTLSLGVFKSYRGEGSMEYHPISFTWAELLDTTIDLGELAHVRWEQAEREALDVSQRAQAEQREREERERKAAAEEAKADKAAREARKAEFRARFPDAAAFLDKNSP